MARCDEMGRPPGRPDAELLVLVQRRATELRLRRRARMLAVVLVVPAVLGVASVAVLPADGGPVAKTAAGPEVGAAMPGRGPAQTTTSLPGVSLTARPAPTTAPRGVPVTTSRPGVSPPARPTPTTVAGGAPPTTFAPAPSTTTSPNVVVATHCHNSHDPVCGPFYFEPPPGPDQPMTVDVTASPGTVAVGQQLVFRIVLRDPDGVSARLASLSVGDARTVFEPTVAPCDRFGPWDPPPLDPTRAVVTSEVPYSPPFPGTYAATLSYEAVPSPCTDSRTGRGDSPYGSAGQGSIEVTVRS